MPEQGEVPRDAEIAQLSIDGALRAAYDAGHTACLTLLDLETYT